MNILERLKNLKDGQTAAFHYRELEEDFVAYHDRVYAELSPEIRARGVAILKEVIDEHDKEFVRQAIVQYGKCHWVHKLMAHFGWGMWIRNQLRDHGLKDDMVPTNNLDDYYVQMVEEAVG